ncbi:MAG: hypothetical protein AAF937_12275 [Planctomycetota bacterium]
MPRVTITQETDTPVGWQFAVEITSRRAGTTTHELAMSFQDYELLCRGTRPPSHVAAELVERLISGEIENAPKPLPERFDAATARRWTAHI